MLSKSQVEHDLFGEMPVSEPRLAPAQAQSPTQALKIVRSQATLTPAQQRFNRLISRIDNLQRSQQDLDDLLLRWSGPHQQAMAQLQGEIEQAERDMLRLLHERLQRPGLNRSQCQRLREWVKKLVMRHASHPQIQELQVQYFDDEDRAQALQDQDSAMAQMRTMAQEMAGGPIPGLDQMREPEEVMAALAQEMLRQQDALAARRQARKARKAPTEHQQRQAEQQLQASSALRTVYRQLASALHPDRESDPSQRIHKTELMSQANAAYGRQDLAALLRLQLQVAQVSPQDWARMADERIDALCLLLKEQVAALQADLQTAEWRASEVLGFPVSAHTHETAVARHLAETERSARETLAQMREDLQQVQQDDGLKRWLKQQKALAKQRARGEFDLNGFY